MSDSGADLIQSEPRRWRLAPDAWRLSGRVTPGRLNRYLRYRSARGLPQSLKARFRAMRIPEQTISEVLGSIRGLSRWMDEWNLAAQKFLTEARAEERSGRWQEAAVARINAAMCFHVAHLVTDTDPRTLRTLRASCVTTFAQAVPRVMPEVRKISLPWRNRTLPAYLALPVNAAQPCPLFVFLNGATTCKEELLLWCNPLLEMGIAVMTVDWPGTGESASFTAPIADCDDMTDGIFGIVDAIAELDASMVAIGGVSLGGAVAIRSAAYDRRLLGAVAITPPYDPLAWWGYVNPLVHMQLMTLGGRNGNPEDIVAEFGLVDLIPRLRSPILVFGAGRDLVIPPDESLLLAAAADDLATLVWYPNGGHCLYREIADWMELTGTWILGLLGEEIPIPSVGQTRRDPVEKPVQAEPRPAPHVNHRVEPQLRKDSTRVESSSSSGQTAVVDVPEDESPEDQTEFDLWDED